VVAAAPNLDREVGGVLVVLPGGALWMGTATAAAAEATKGTGLSAPYTLSIAGYGHDHLQR